MTKKAGRTGDRPPRERGSQNAAAQEWLMHDAIIHLNQDTPALRDAVAMYQQAVGAKDITVQKTVGKHILWPALFDKVKNGTIIAMGRRPGAADFEPIGHAAFYHSDPDFANDCFTQGGSRFEFVYFVLAAPTRFEGLLSQSNAALPAGRGPRPVVLPSVVAAMLADLQSGRTTPVILQADTEEALHVCYGPSRGTCRKARIQALSEFLIVTNSDK